MRAKRPGICNCLRCRSPLYRRLCWWWDRRVKNWHRLVTCRVHGHIVPSPYSWKTWCHRCGADQTKEKLMTYPKMSEVAAEHYAQAVAFQGPDNGGYAQGDITAGKGGDAALQSGGFAGSEVNAHTGEGQITQPDDSVQT